MEIDPGRRPRNLLLLVFFCVGIVAGVSATLGFGLFCSTFHSAKSYMAGQLGKFLDTDFVYLRTGPVLKGRIVSEDKKTIGIALDNRTVQIDSKDVTAIEKDYYTRYLKGPR
jgi:hypothetical protein